MHLFIVWNIKVCSPAEEILLSSSLLMSSSCALSSAMAFFALSKVWCGANITLDKSSYPVGAERDCQLWGKWAEMFLFHVYCSYRMWIYGSQSYWKILMSTCKKWMWSSEWDSCSRSLCFFLSSVISSSSLSMCLSACDARSVSRARIISFTSVYLLSRARSSSAKIRSFSSSTLWEDCYGKKTSVCHSYEVLSCALYLSDTSKNTKGWFWEIKGIAPSCGTQQKTFQEIYQWFCVHRGQCWLVTNVL